MLSLSNFFFLVLCVVMVKEQFFESDGSSLGMKELLNFLSDVRTMSFFFVRDVGYLYPFIKKMILCFYGLHLKN